MTARRWRMLMLVGAGALLGALAGAPAAVTDAASAGSAVPATEATPPPPMSEALFSSLSADPCPGNLQVVGQAEAGGPTMCTHGADRGLTPDEVVAEQGATTEASSGIHCYGNGTSGDRVQLVYAYAGTNRFSALRSAIENRAAAIDAIYNASAAETGGERHVRWVTDAACNLDIQTVHVLATAIPLAGFSGTLIPALRALGLSANSRKYLIWADTGRSPTINSGTCSGVGTLFADERTSPTENFNNLQVGYTRVDETCLFSLFDRVAGKVEAHELMHTLGAVQGRLVLTGGTVWTVGAPHHTEYGHCTDDYDIMCYADGPGTVVNRVCADQNHELRLDCNHDDYFSTNPTGYLRTHWNTADSSWLEGGTDAAQAPGSPQSVRGIPGDNQITLSWAAPSSDGGEAVTGYRVYRNGTPVSSTTVSSASATRALPTSFVDTDVRNGSTYSYQVSAVNSVGEGTKSGAVSIMAGTPKPDAQVSVAGTGPFIGDDVYRSSAPNEQLVTQGIGPSATATSYVRIENDRAGADSLKVKGVTSGSSGFTVRYFLGTTEITSQVVAGSYTIPNLAAGAHVDLRVRITAGPTAVAGGTGTATITVKSRTISTIKDVVQTRATRT